MAVGRGFSKEVVRREERTGLTWKLSSRGLNVYKLQEWNCICILPGVLSHCGRGVEVEIYIPWLTKPATASRVDWSDEDAHCLRKTGLPKQRVCSKGIVSSWKD